MAGFFPKVFDLEESRDLINRVPYGMIEAAAGEFQFVQLRPWPKLISGLEAMWQGVLSHRRVHRDRVQVWYNQPRAHRNFLALSYGLSAIGTTRATIRAAHQSLDRIAEIKQSDAILCHVTNRRITDRVMHHYGYERHLTQRRGRHFIRRFYGNYPAANSGNIAIARTESTDSIAEVAFPSVQMDAMPGADVGV